MDRAKVAIVHNGVPIRVIGRNVGLEEAKLLLLLGVKPAFSGDSWKLRSLLGIPEVLARLVGIPSPLWNELDVCV